VVVVTRRCLALGAALGVAGTLLALAAALAAFGALVDLLDRAEAGEIPPRWAAP
jgi:hypothetical protein